jgi:hypothetical protein
MRCLHPRGQQSVGFGFRRKPEPILKMTKASVDCFHCSIPLVSQDRRVRPFLQTGGMLGQKVIPNKNSAWFWLLEKPPLGSRKCCAPHRV